MLSAGYASHPRLPQNDLVYVAFRICYYDLLTAIETESVIGEPENEAPDGYLTAVPFFSSVPSAVQIDLLAEVWARHHAQSVHPATMKHAAVLWSILSSAGWIARQNWDGDVSIILEGGPRKITVKLDDALEAKWNELFDSFWDDSDFLTISDQMDLPPDQVAATRDLLGIPQDWVDEMFDVLSLIRASPSITENLRGLLTDQEIADHRELLHPAD